MKIQGDKPLFGLLKEYVKISEIHETGGVWHKI
jgi:hypothetical protein